MEIRQLVDEVFILPTRSDGELYYRQQLSICEDQGFTHETVHGHTVLNSVTHGLGITFLPSSFAKFSNARVKFVEMDKIPKKLKLLHYGTRETPIPVFQNSYPLSIN
ncbi:hypothetical protein QWY93_10840 [Echinicola jeungdonensis]|uniref:LysR substrate-binding domain-containing protein n=1 Tax=Echinicola jeungdonensis TaxID=709343 RepID=A0ABV5J8A6_9BACT|nr:hypothetical protein [Echinicola jeungdonensis]MDN3669820.1 hypothetical protein [Echinicola jeungdonensis]